MKLHEKLKSIIQTRKLSLSALHRTLASLFENDAIAYLTLYRTVQGKTTVREHTLFQIAYALGITTNEIKEGTEQAGKPGEYVYSRKARLDILSDETPFLPGRLILGAGASTPDQKAPESPGGTFKWLFVLQGEMVCVIEQDQQTKEHCLKKGESLSWPGGLPHRIENRGKRKATAIVVQYPNKL